MFQFIDQPSRRIEGFAAVRRTDGNGDAGFRGSDVAQAMDHDYFAQRPTAVRLGFEPLHLHQRHLPVGLIYQVRCLDALDRFRL